MNKWYRKTVAKVAVLMAGVLGGSAFLTSLAVVTTLAGTINPSGIMQILNEPYEESTDFNMSVENAVNDVFQQFRLKQFFEMDGAYNPDKVVDIGESARELSENTSRTYGIKYTLDELVDWGEDFYTGEGDLYSDNDVIVCQKPGGEYYYYYLEDFLALFDRGQLFMEFEGEGMDQAAYLRGLEDGVYTSSGEAGDMMILDAEGKTVYTDCWNFGESLREKYAPQGAENILQIVNDSPWLNGRLSYIYDELEMALATMYGDYERYQSGWDYLDEGNTNLTYLYVDTVSKKVETNRSEFEDYAEAEANLKKMKSGDNVKYVFVYPKLKDFESNMNLSPTGEWQMVKDQDGNRKSENIFAVAVDTTYPIEDMLYEGKVNYEKNLPLLETSMISLVVGIVVFLTAAVWLAMTAGKYPEDEDVHLTTFDRWKTELAALTVIAVWAVVTAFAVGGGYITEGWHTGALASDIEYYTGYYGGIPQLYSALFTAALGLSDVVKVYLYSAFSFLCFFAGYVSLFRRIKAKTMWKGSLLYAVLCFGGKVIKERSSTTKTILLSGGFLFIHWMAILVRSMPFAFVTLAVDAVAVWFVLGRAMAKTKIKKGIEEIASGNLEYRIDLSGLRGGDRELAEKVNGIGSGLNKAVDEAMRNERLKTDLITNVSHDIKTPLTSIINYVDILKRSEIADEKVRGYLDILEAKAQRLKTLTEDVVEASKVSSGNISLEYMDVDLRELVQQTEGELAERFAARNLTMVLNMPEEPAIIRVDGRRMWRVLENVFGNAAKYAMPGTRVYADLTMTEETVRFSLKNVSEQQLNFSADELTERFIRGDISRSTEGSGLGLSIAKSLTAMQGGEFGLYLDGDLFKVDIAFPRQ